MNRIKIVFILGTLVIGGTERQLLETLRKLNHEQFECKVLSFDCYGKYRKKLEKLGVSFTCLNFQYTKGILHPLSYIRIYKLILGIIRYLRQERPHIVQSYLDWANIWGAIAAKISGVPVIITGRRVTMDPEYMKFYHGMRFYSRWLLNFTNAWVTAIVANSDVVKQHCLQREKFITNEKIRVIYNGIDLNCYTVNIGKEEKMKELHIPNNNQVVGMVASLHPRKGHSDFLKAASIALRTYPHTVFLLVGRDDGMKPILETFAKELNIQSSVFFTGERDDIPELLSIFNVQVSSSYAEGLSNALLEGMAAGKPIVATEVGGNSELIVHGETGFVVPTGEPYRLAEAIMQLLDNKQLQVQMGNAGRQRVGQLFGIDRMIHHTETLYIKLASKHL